MARIHRRAARGERPDRVPAAARLPGCRTPTTRSWSGSVTPPAARLRMSELAVATLGSRSRLSHAVARLESNGWVRREGVEDDRRGQVAILTAAGPATLREAAPGHVEAVRVSGVRRASPRRSRSCTTSASRCPAVRPNSPAATTERTPSRTNAATTAMTPAVTPAWTAARTAARTAAWTTAWAAGATATRMTCGTAGLTRGAAGDGLVDHSSRDCRRRARRHGRRAGRCLCRRSGSGRRLVAVHHLGGHHPTARYVARDRVVPDGRTDPDRWPVEPAGGLCVGGGRRDVRPGRRPLSW